MSYLEFIADHPGPLLLVLVLEHRVEGGEEVTVADQLTVGIIILAQKCIFELLPVRGAVFKSKLQAGLKENWKKSSSFSHIYKSCLAKVCARWPERKEHHITRRTTTTRSSLRLWSTLKVMLIRATSKKQRQTDIQTNGRHIFKNNNNNAIRPWSFTPGKINWTR